MKFFVELVLVAILLVLLYEKPEFLVRFSNSTLGKLLTIGAVILVSQSCGLTAGILSVLIVIILRHTWLEGFETTDVNSSAFVIGNTNPDTIDTKSAKPAPAPTTSDQQKKCNPLCAKNETCEDGICKAVLSINDQLKVEEQVGERNSHRNTLAASQQGNMQTNN